MRIGNILGAVSPIHTVLSKFCGNALERSTRLVIVYAELFQTDFRMNIFYDLSFLKIF